MVTCPVCGMELDREDAMAQMEYQGETYYFCSEQCEEQFEVNPERYAKQQQPF